MNLPEENRPAKLICDLQSIGHYQEKNIQLHVNLEDLEANQTIVYEMVLDSQSGNWEIVVMQDNDRNMVGIAEFTQL